MADIREILARHPLGGAKDNEEEVSRCLDLAVDLMKNGFIEEGMGAACHAGWIKVRDDELLPRIPREAS